MYTLLFSRKFKNNRNRCDHIWVEEVFLTKLGKKLKAFMVRLDKEVVKEKGDNSGVVKTRVARVPLHSKGSC